MGSYSYTFCLLTYISAHLVRLTWTVCPSKVYWCFCQNSSSHTPQTSLNFASKSCQPAGKSSEMDFTSCPSLYSSIPSRCLSSPHWEMSTHHWTCSLSCFYEQIAACSSNKSLGKCSSMPLLISCLYAGPWNLFCLKWKENTLIAVKFEKQKGLELDLLRESNFETILSLEIANCQLNFLIECFTVSFQSSWRIFIFTSLPMIISPLKFSPMGSLTLLFAWAFLNLSVNLEFDFPKNDRTLP